MPRPQPLLEVAVLLSSPVRQVTWLWRWLWSIGGSTCKYGFRFTNAGVVYPIINGSGLKSIHRHGCWRNGHLYPARRQNIYLRVDGTEVRQEPYPFRMQLTQTQMWALSERKEQSPPWTWQAWDRRNRWCRLYGRVELWPHTGQGVLGLLPQAYRHAHRPKRWRWFRHQQQ